MLDHATCALSRRITPFAILAVALTFFASSSADAQRRDEVELVELELAPDDGRRRGRLALHYSLAGRARPDVELHITIDAARRERDVVAVLDHPRGWIPLGRAGRGATVMVRATDRAGRVLGMRLGRGLVVTALELSSAFTVERAFVEEHWGGPVRRPGRRVDDPRRPGPARGGNLAVVDAACDRAFIAQDKEAACLRTMRNVPRAPAIIAACDRAFTGEDAAFRCLQARPDPVVVDACDQAFVGQPSTLRCLDTQASPRAIQSCERMFTGDASALRCLNIVGRSRARDREIDEAFAVCGRRVGEAQELRCLQDTLGRRRR